MVPTRGSDSVAKNGGKTIDAKMAGNWTQPRHKYVACGVADAWMEPPPGRSDPAASHNGMNPSGRVAIVIIY